MWGTGIEPHKQLDRVNRPESFYDIEALGKMMDEYYHTSSQSRPSTPGN